MKQVTYIVQYNHLGWHPVDQGWFYLESDARHYIEKAKLNFDLRVVKRTTTEEVIPND